MTSLFFTVFILAWAGLSLLAPFAFYFVIRKGRS